MDGVPQDIIQIDGNDFRHCWWSTGAQESMNTSAPHRNHHVTTVVQLIYTPPGTSSSVPSDPAPSKWAGSGDPRGLNSSRPNHSPITALLCFSLSPASDASSFKSAAMLSPRARAGSGPTNALDALRSCTDESDTSEWRALGMGWNKPVRGSTVLC